MPVTIFVFIPAAAVWPIDRPRFLTNSGIAIFSAISGIARTAASLAVMAAPPAYGTAAVSANAVWPFLWWKSLDREPF